MVNPIKTPLQMMYEQAGVPHLAGGKAVSAGGQQILKKAIEKFKSLSGRAPNAEELAGLQEAVTHFSKPTSPVLRSGPSAQPRAAFELATDPNLINPETARDEFLTKMTTGRTTKGTRLRPMASDITDPAIVKNIEGQQMAGNLDEIIPGASQGSITPSADYFAERSRSLENSALEGGTLDDLKRQFAEKFGRYPDPDELNAIIAEYNPLRHQYGEQGIGIMSERPPTAKGMMDWRNRARNEGIPETYLFERSAKYPDYIKNELELQKGNLPPSAIKDAKKRVPKEVEPIDFYIDENGNAVKIYPTMKAEGGHITPEEMRHAMIALGQEPAKYKKGGKTGIEMIEEYIMSKPDEEYRPKVQAYEPGIRESVTDKIAPYLEKMGMSPRRAYEQASTITGYTDGGGSMFSPTMVFDPIAPFAAVESLGKGDIGDAMLNAIALPGQVSGLKGLRSMGKKIK